MLYAILLVVLVVLVIASVVPRSIAGEGSDQIGNPGNENFEAFVQRQLDACQNWRQGKPVPEFAKNPALAELCNATPPSAEGRGSRIVDRLLRAATNGAALGVFFAIVIGLPGIVIAIIRKYRRGWRPTISFVSRSVISIWIVWIAGVWLWNLVTGWSATVDEYRYEALMFGPPILLLVTICLWRWTRSAGEPEM